MVYNGIAASNIQLAASDSKKSAVELTPVDIPSILLRNLSTAFSTILFKSFRGISSSLINLLRIGFAKSG